MTEKKWFMEGELGELYEKALESMNLESENNTNDKDAEFDDQSHDKNEDLSDWEQEYINCYEDDGVFVFHEIKSSSEANVNTQNNPKSSKLLVQQISRSSNSSPHRNGFKKCDRRIRDSCDGSTRSLTSHRTRKKRSRSHSSNYSSGGSSYKYSRKSNYNRNEREKCPERSAHQIKNLVKRRDFR